MLRHKATWQHLHRKHMPVPPAEAEVQTAHLLICKRQELLRQELLRRELLRRELLRRELLRRELLL